MIKKFSFLFISLTKYCLSQKSVLKFGVFSTISVFLKSLATSLILYNSLKCPPEEETNNIFSYYSAPFPDNTTPIVKKINLISYQKPLLF